MDIKMAFFLFILAGLILIVVGISLDKKEIIPTPSFSSPTPIIPSIKPANPSGIFTTDPSQDSKYLNNQDYCERNDDCKLLPPFCNCGCPHPGNIYKPYPMASCFPDPTNCPTRCPPGEAICEYNKCVFSPIPAASGYPTTNPRYFT